MEEVTGSSDRVESLEASEPAAATSRTMKAMVQSEYGTADAIQLLEIGMPDIAADEVLLEVHAGGLDRGTLHLMNGQPYLIRLMGYGLRAPKNSVPGLDVAGTVVAIGAEVTRFQVGDDVFGISNGSFAEFASAPEDKLALKPANLSLTEAAVVAVSSLPALQGLRDVARLQAGQSVLVVGASGGVGTYAVQIAKSLGGEVTGVASSGKLDLVRSIGADHVIDYTREDFADGERHYDVILDIGGRSPVSRLRRALAPRGTLVIVGGEGGGRWTGGIGRQLWAMTLSLFIRQRLTTFISKETYVDLEVVKGLLEGGEITPTLDETFAIDRLPEAIDHLESGHARGKIAITVAAA